MNASPTDCRAGPDITAAGRPDTSIEETVKTALIDSDQVDAQFNGAICQGDVCFPMGLADALLSVIGVKNDPELTLPERRVIGAAVALLTSATRNVQLLTQTRENSVRDPLTSCFNRAYALETLQTELMRARRSGRPLSVMMFDVDRFKRRNDDHGHLAGDAVWPRSPHS